MKGEGLRVSAVHIIAIDNLKEFPEIFNVSTQRRLHLKVVKNKLPPNAHAKMCNQNCRGTGLVTPSVPPLPYEQLCLYPLLISRCFWKDSLMIPTTPPQAFFTVATLPIHHLPPPPPNKKSDHTQWATLSKNNREERSDTKTPNYLV